MGYPGGKGKSYHQIINIIPPHHTYIETHLGGGSILRQKVPAIVNVGVDRDPAVIRRWRQLFPSLATYIEADAVDFLASRSFFGDEVVYCDPPYLPTTRRRNPVYRYDYCEADHVRLLDALLRLPCRVIVSGYPSELYDEHLRSWSTKTFTARTHHGIREEKLWFNFKKPECLHDGRHLGGNFRERQTVKRRLERLRKRISNLSPLEQYALFELVKAPQQKSGEPIATVDQPNQSLVLVPNRRAVQMPLFADFDSGQGNEMLTISFKRKAMGRVTVALNLGAKQVDADARTQPRSRLRS